LSSLPDIKVNKALVIMFFFKRENIYTLFLLFLFSFIFECGTAHKQCTTGVGKRVCMFCTCAVLQMTRSAPPERTLTRRTASHGHGRREVRPRLAPRPTSTLSVEDIYRTAENERLQYCTSSRLQNLAHAQSQTAFFRHEQSTYSRPNTSMSRDGNSTRRDTNTPMSAWSEPLISRPSSIIPHPGR